MYRTLHTLLFMPIAIVVIGTGGIQIATAQENASTTREARMEDRNEAQETRQELREEAVENRQELRTERRTALSELVQNRIRNLAANITNRLTAALDRMDNIALRLESRMDTLAQNGVDTTTASATLSEAQTTLSEARIALAAIPSIEDAVSGETPRESYAAIRSVFVGVRDKIKTAHGLLRETVALLAQGLNDRSETPTE